MFIPQKVLLSLIAVLTAVGSFLSGARLETSPAPVLGGFQNGVVTVVATSSRLTVNTTAISALATSTCSSRTITTTTKPIMITFSDYVGHTPTGIFGHLQAASSTVVYDAGLNGCGLLKIYGFDGDSNVTVTEYR